MRPQADFERQVLSPALVLVCLAVLVAGCSGGGDDERVAPARAWPGPPRADQRGRFAVAGFNEFLITWPELRRSPLAAGIVFARLDRVDARTTSAVATTGPEGGDRAVVVLTADGLLDDSVRATRYTLVFARSSSNWRLSSARQTQRCWPRRGHQNFSHRVCV